MEENHREGSNPKWVVAPVKEEEEYLITYSTNSQHFVESVFSLSCSQNLPLVTVLSQIQVYDVSTCDLLDKSWDMSKGGTRC